MNKLAVLMACYNRRETTLRCLTSLRDEVEKVGGDGQWKLDVFLVDDGSTDGTSAAVKERYPFVKILQTGGGFYWAKSMSRAWSAAVASEEVASWKYDGFLWLNDDVVLHEHAIEALVRNTGLEHDYVAVGEFVDANGVKTYGLNGYLFNGNCVLVSRKVYEKVGMICGAYAHAWADSDYAMRCHRKGVLPISAGIVGTCEGHPLRPSLKGRGLRWRLRALRDPKGWNLHDLWLYRKRNWGYLVALASSVHFIIRVLFYD